MKPFLLTGGVLAASLAGAAFAQSLSPNQSSDDAARRAQGIIRPETGGQSILRDGQRTSTLPDRTEPQGDRAADGAATAPAYPSHWTGDAVSWNAHARACAARYRTYDATTDEYFALPGVRRRCRLAMPG